MANPTLEDVQPISPENLGLWAPQLTAVRRMQAYIRAYREGGTSRAALVQMPTGSGKTGVIAALARCLPDIGCVLILSPRIGLREQLLREISAGFFQNLCPPVDPGRLLKRVREISEARQLEGMEDFDATVLIATVQLVTSLHKLHEAEWQDLLEHVSLVVVDEGHCEPAPSWSLAIRSFRAPKIIFTATPFRNDLKIFEIDLAHTYTYTYRQALQDGILREVEFIPMEPCGNPNAFVDDVLGFYDRQFKKVRGEKPRIIIRCDGREEIRQVGTALKMRGRDYIAIHETFVDGENPSEYRRVPDPKQQKAPIWVHQFKLQEGIDDPRFQVLAVYGEIQNGRDLVQQVGRIIRNPEHDPASKAYVLDHSGGQHWDLWLGFLKYDDGLFTYGPEAFNLATGSEWLAGLFESQPMLTYMKYRFCKPLDLNQLVPHEDLLLPRLVNLRYKEHNFRMEDLCALLEDAFRAEDRVYQRYEEEGAVIYVYVRFDNSPLLYRKYFLEPQLGVTYLREMRDLLAYYDSSGSLPVDYQEACLGKAVRSDIMKKLFSNHVRTHLTQVSLRNSNLNKIAIRSHNLSAADVLNTVSAFDDHVQLCANVTGYTQEEQGWLRRYLGFEHGRVAESGGRDSLEQYEHWLAGVVDTLDQPRTLHSTFRRYAQLADAVRDPSARHILLDLSEVENQFETVGGIRGRRTIAAGQPMKIENLACEVVNDCFTLNANGAKIAISIQFDDQRRRYILDSPPLDALYCRQKGDTDKRGVIDYLNQEQSFRVIPNTGNLIYALGDFYQPPFKVGQYFNPNYFEVSQVLKAVPLLGKIKEEKGVLSDPLGWSPDTLFGIIARLGEPAGLQEDFGDPDILVCDDMGTEAADFILAETRTRRVVFIHAKASRQLHPVSASTLQEVVGQATKNINFLGMFNESSPANLRRWDDPWSNPKALCTTPRIRRGFPKKAPRGQETWERLQAIIRHPLADKEVWLFMGQMLSKKKFEAELGKPLVGAEALQAAYLLFAALTNVASVGAKLRIFCYP